MRFFAHDGKAVHGPAVPVELLKLPGFDGDTLVCPVGSENSADWKPALAYPPFRAALLAPAPKLAPPPPPPPSSPPPVPCPRCRHANPEGARFCNACAARVDGREEPPSPAFAAADAVASPPEPVPDLVELEPVTGPQPISAPAASMWRKILIASCAGAAVATGALGWRLLRRPKPAARSVAAVNPTASPQTPASPTPPAATMAAAPLVTAAPAASPMPLPPTSPAAAAPAAPAKSSRRKSRPARKLKPALKKEETLIESHDASGKSPIPGDADGAPAAPPSAEDRGFLLPGVPRRVPPQSATKPNADAAAEDGATRQVREQFSFCAQLLSQAAYADHFDTCLCAAARQAAPYRGRRGYYATALKKAAAAGALETAATVASIVLDGPIAKVTAEWKAGASEKPRTETENWQLEDGLWCRSP